MANSNDFDLKRAIDNWVVELKSKDFSLERVEELESHLGDLLSDLKSDKLSEEEQFMIAMHRIGSTETLKKAHDYEAPFNFQRFSGIAQGITYFLIFGMLSRVAVGATNKIFVWIDSQNQLLYLSLSLVFQLIALGGVFLVYRKVTQAKVKNQSELGSNVIAISGIFLTLMLYFCGLYFLRPTMSSLSLFPIIQSLFPYLIPATFFIGLLVKTVKEWKKERRIRALG